MLTPLSVTTLAPGLSASAHACASACGRQALFVTVHTVEAHLSSCAGCAALVTDLRRIEAEARALPSLAPSRDLWDGIRARIDDRPGEEDDKVVALRLHRPRPAVRWQAWMTRAAAAVALVVLSSGATAYWLTRRDAGERVAVAPATRA